eukprot:PhF_6_TR15022/c0_g1_i1/m.23560
MPPMEEGKGIRKNQPPDTPFKQQKMTGVQPIYSPVCMITTLVLASILFLALGASILIAAESSVEVIQQYDHLAKVNDTTKLTVEFEVPKTMKKPVFLYYQLGNYYQNHRRYARSKSEAQLSGQDATENQLLDCEARKSPKGYDSLIYNPCGLIAWSMFNDTFVLSQVTGADGKSLKLICDGTAFNYKGDPIVGTPAPTKASTPSTTPPPTTTSPPGTPITPAPPVTAAPATPSPPTEAPRVNYCTKAGIAWPTDAYAAPSEKDTVTYKGISGHPNFYIRNGLYMNEDNHTIPNPQDEDFMVWMRIAPLSTFNKLYRVINIDLEKGKYKMDILHRYDVSRFQGTKSFVLLTSTWVGGVNRALAGFYLTVGCVTLKTIL